jgi:hypothetical protein
LPEIARPAIEKFGFASAALIEQWSDIVGSEFAAYCQPERIRWPRKRGEQQDGEAGDTREAATLVLRVAPAKALDVQYARGQIIDRVNTCFGYRAISRLTIVQAPIPQAAPRASIAPSAKVADSSHPGLEGALERMQALRRQASERRR